MNNTVKIILIIATFVACAVLGYFVMPSKDSNPDSNIAQISGGGGGGGGNIGGVRNPAAGRTDSANSANEEAERNDAATDDTDAEPVAEQTAEPDGKAGEETPAGKPVPNVETTPEIKSTIVAQRSSKNYKKIGVAFTVRAVVASNDPLVYELYEIGGTTAKYTSNNGSFPNVYPVAGGKYLLKVVNRNTGDASEREVAGFDKIKKYTVAELQEQLNTDSQERLFYCHFDTDHLKFDCEGVDPSEKPVSLNALSSSRSANGWVLTVVGSPKYDKYNRITYFKVRVTE